jgi:NAD(P)-dependent dehydrogenase (short-subunit alcohol dehydrogenase family)
MHLDLASLASVRSFAAALPAVNVPPLRAIVANAGVSRKDVDGRSEDGFELTFAVNHLGHFLLVNLLLDQLQTPARIINVSSGRHDPDSPHMDAGPHYVNAYGLAYPETDPMPDDDPVTAGARAYNTSKLCNLFFTYELVRRLEKNGFDSPDHSITVNAFNPGLIAGTGLNREGSARSRFIWYRVLPLMRSFIPGAYTARESGDALAQLVTDPVYAAMTGKYFNLLEENRSSAESYDRKKATELWQTSLSLTGLQPDESPLML